MKIIKEENFNDESKESIIFKNGGLWEENEIVFQREVPIYDANRVNCPHLGEKYKVRTYRRDKSYFDNIYANCPRVIVARNEGGYNTTGVCLDCLLENLEKIGEK